MDIKNNPSERRDCWGFYRRFFFFAFAFFFFAMVF
jgi:hypothetical protein